MKVHGNLSFASKKQNTCPDMLMRAISFYGCAAVLEYLEILRGIFGNTYSDERVIPCVCFVVILCILYHINTAPQGFLGWSFKHFPFCLICLLFFVSILWIQKQFTAAMTVKVMPPWMPTHLSSLSKLFLFYTFIQRDRKITFSEVVFCPFLLSKRQKDCRMCGQGSVLSLTSPFSFSSFVEFVEDISILYFHSKR